MNIFSGVVPGTWEWERKGGSSFHPRRPPIGWGGVAPGTREPKGGWGSLTPNPELMALSVHHRWGAHLEIYQYLQELKRRHLEGQSQGLVIKSDDERAAVDVAQKWLKLIDEEKYEESWQQASQYLKQQFDQKKWIRARQATPHPKTRAQRRVLDQLQFLPKAPPGQGEAPAVMLRFRTPGADVYLYEVVVLAKLDGRWQPTGYQISQAPANPTAPMPRNQKRKCLTTISFPVWRQLEVPVLV